MKWNGGTEFILQYQSRKTGCEILMDTRSWETKAKKNIACDQDKFPAGFGLCQLQQCFTPCTLFEVLT